MGDIRSNITNCIIYNRKKLKLSQKELAEKMGVKNTTVSSWERGANAPDIEIIFDLCTLFDIRVHEMFGKDTISEHDISSFSLSSLELSLIKQFRSLSSNGQEKVLDRLNELKTLGYNAGMGKSENLA